MTQKKTTNGEKKNTPTHRVVFQKKTAKGFGPTTELGGAWVNKAGGISFPFAGGSVTIWPINRENGEE